MEPQTVIMKERPSPGANHQGDVNAGDHQAAFDEMPFGFR
jgi:hypothetical protein